MLRLKLVCECVYARMLTVNSYWFSPCPRLALVQCITHTVYDTLALLPDHARQPSLRDAAARPMNARCRATFHSKLTSSRIGHQSISINPLTYLASFAVCNSYCHSCCLRTYSGYDGSLYHTLRPKS